MGGLSYPEYVTFEFESNYMDQVTMSGNGFDCLFYLPYLRCILQGLEKQMESLDIISIVVVS